MFQETIWGLANAAELDCVLIAAGTKLQGVGVGRQFRVPAAETV